MTGRVRYLLAAAFVLLFVLFPEADHARLTFLETKSWLTSEVLAPAFEGRPAREAVPRVHVDYAAQGMADSDRQARAAELERAVREWARGQGRDVDASLPALQLTVRLGENGFRSTLSQEPPRLIEGPRVLELLHTVPDGVAPPGGHYPDRWSLTPAFLAIVLAILFGRVIPSLLAGCIAGAWLFRGDLAAGIGHFAADTLVTGVLLDQFHIEIIGFVFFLFMTVGVMTRSGGIQGMVEVVRRFARGPVSAQLATWVIGILIFFDDYSNCIITGSTMRPLTDRCGVAREKLAYIVDATAAPIAGVSIFSTWVAYEVSMFAPQLPEVLREDGTPFRQSDGFSVFVQTLPVRFYCLFTIVMVFLTIVMRREFGPMLAAARRAAHEGKPLEDDAHPLVSESLDRIEPPAGAPLRARNAVLPVLLLVVTTIALIFTFGYSALAPAARELPWYEMVSEILGNGQSQRALCIAAAAAFVLASALAAGQRILTVRDAVVSALRSARSLLFAIVILVLAWCIGETCADVGTARYLTAAFHGAISPWLLPAILFALSSLVAFSTGTSYGTMSILLPNVVVLAHTLGQSDPDLGGPALMVLTIGAVLEGSIFGDHCSPISDTTVLSSVASGSDHMHHVRTQAPYAVVVMAIALVFGYLPTAWAGPDSWPIAWALGVGALVVFMLLVGRRVATPPSVAGRLQDAG